MLPNPSGDPATLALISVWCRGAISRARWTFPEPQLRGHSGNDPGTRQRRARGGITLLELADKLSVGAAWHGIPGLAWREGGEIVSAPLRPLIHDLDALPYPDRTQIERAFLGRRSTHILASRGCIRTCSFCSIHMFYRAAPGKVVRTRDPARVVDEIELLHEQHHISLFLFQDDDFPVYGLKWRRWAATFCDELQRRGSPGPLLWQ